MPMLTTVEAEEGGEGREFLVIFFLWDDKNSAGSVVNAYMPVAKQSNRSSFREGC